MAARITDVRTADTAMPEAPPRSSRASPGPGSYPVSDDQGRADRDRRPEPERDSLRGTEHHAPLSRVVGAAPPILLT